MKGVTAMKELPAEKKNQRLTAAESNGHIVAYKACVILADRHRGIEQGRQRISPDIAHQGRIPVKAVHDILDMPAVQLQKAALYDLRTHIEFFRKLTAHENTVVQKYSIFSLPPLLNGVFSFFLYFYQKMFIFLLTYLPICAAVLIVHGQLRRPFDYKKHHLYP